MSKLLKLELQRINLRPYLTASAVSGLVLLGFTYFVAYVAQREQETQFMNYENIFLFTRAISILMFSVLSATMYARVILGEYSGKRLALLFSYPVSRKKIFAAKIGIVFLFVFLSMLLCTVLPILLFALTESFAPIVSDTMTTVTLLSVLRSSLTALPAVGAIGILAMRIGFIKKSVPATLISAAILSALYANTAIDAAANPLALLLLSGLSLAAALVVLLTMSAKINHMEVES